MSRHDRQAVFALQFADDIATVAAGETDTVIRERPGGLGEGVRALLRDALYEIDAADATRRDTTPALAAEVAGPVAGTSR
jgi:hypothetical protein